jgi:hypothetical protein
VVVGGEQAAITSSTLGSCVNVGGRWGTWLDEVAALTGKRRIARAHAEQLDDHDDTTASPCVCCRSYSSSAASFTRSTQQLHPTCSRGMCGAGSISKSVVAPVALPQTQRALHLYIVCVETEPERKL